MTIATPTALHIIRFESSNVKRIKAIEIVPTSRMVKIAGKNGAGKSSVLDAIWYALGGKDVVCDQPIRRGASKAHVTLELRDLTITRKWTTNGGSTLSIKSSDGQPIKSPQELLDSLCNLVCFDPLAFVTMEAQKQLETLRKLVGLDFTDINTKRKDAYDRRTLANRELSVAKVRLGNNPFDASAPAQEVSIKLLMEQLKAIQEKQKQHAEVARETLRVNNQVKQDWESTVRDVESCQTKAMIVRNEISELELEVAAKKRLLAAVEQEHAKNCELLKEKEQKVAGLVYPNLDQIQEHFERMAEPVKLQITQADETNTKVRANRIHNEAREEVRSVQGKVDALTAEIETCDAEKEELLANAKFPLPGMTFDESGVLLDGVPFNQGSTAQQIRAAIAIGLALNPRIRVLLIRNGSLLDETSMAVVEQMAEEKDAQIWIEVVGDDVPATVIIEDGELKEAA